MRKQVLRGFCELSKGLTALSGHATLASAPQVHPYPGCLLSQGLLTFSSPSLCASVNLPHPTELSLLRGNAPQAPASLDTPTQHLSYSNHCNETICTPEFCPRLSFPPERQTPWSLPLHPAHMLTGCLKFPLPTPSPPHPPSPLPRLTGEGRETDPLHIFIHQAASLRSPPLIQSPGAGLSWPGDARIRITYSRCSRAR